MFSKIHVEALLERARLGEKIDLSNEVEYMIKSEFKLSDNTIKELYQIGSVCNFDDNSYLIYESRLHKIE